MVISVMYRRDSTPALTDNANLFWYGLVNQGYYVSFMAPRQVTDGRNCSSTRFELSE
jgi:hypothetical protein